MSQFCLQLVQSATSILTLHTFSLALRSVAVAAALCCWLGRISIRATCNCTRFAIASRCSPTGCGGRQSSQPPLKLWAFFSAAPSLAPLSPAAGRSCSGSRRLRCCCFCRCENRLTRTVRAQFARGVFRSFTFFSQSPKSHKNPSNY